MRLGSFAARLGRRRRGSAGASIPEPEQISDWARRNAYPVLDAQVLLRALHQTDRLRTIERLVSTTPSAFESLYLDAIERFVEAAQMVPASTVDHHREPGGWIDHTLEVVELALQERKNHLLPPGAKPELIHAKESLWTYATFAVALLHDAGKLITLTALRPLSGSDAERWIPGGETLAEAGVSSYAIEWARYGYDLQQSSSIGLFGMLPDRARTMLLGDEEVLRQVLSALTDDWQGSTLATIVNTADRLSCARYAAPGIAPRQPLVNAPVQSLAKRMMRALRLEIADGSLALNRDGAAGWTTPDTAWLVCRPTVAKIRERMAREGHRDVPQDDQRVYDVLRDHGLLIATAERRSVWSVLVRAGDYEHPLTMLRFARGMVIHPSQAVPDLEGSIEIIDRERLLELRAAAKERSSGTDDGDGSVAPAADAEERPAPEQVDDPASTASGEAAATDPPERADGAPPASSPSDSGSTAGADEPAPASPDSPSSSPSANAPKNERAASSTAAEGARDASPEHSPQGTGKKKRSGARTARERAADAVVDQINGRGRLDRRAIRTEPVGVDDDAAGRYFLVWVREQIDARAPNFGVNDEESLVHRVAEGTFLVHPKIFQQFLMATRLAPSGGEKAMKPMVDTVRTRLRIEGLLTRTENGYDVHHADVGVASNPYITKPLYGVLVPDWALFDDHELPPVNGAVTVWQGRYRTGQRTRPRAKMRTSTS